MMIFWKHYFFYSFVSEHQIVDAFQRTGKSRFLDTFIEGRGTRSPECAVCIFVRLSIMADTALVPERY